jgi:hypothetical protein
MTNIYLWIWANWCKEELSIQHECQHMMATGSLASFNPENVWSMPNIQLLIHLFVIWAPGEGEPLAFFIADLTHQYSEVVSVLKL